MTAIDLRRSARHGASGYTADVAALRLQHLLLRGFSADAADRIFEAVSLPATADLDQRISDLEALGFKDPVKMITSSPAILGYAIDNIRGKLTDLEALGFKDPVKMITSLPAILGLAIDNIRGKLTDLEALGFKDPVKMITSSPAILGYSRERFCLCAGIVARCADAPATGLSWFASRRRPLIDAVAEAKPATWRAVRTIIRDGSKQA